MSEMSAGAPDRADVTTPNGDAIRFDTSLKTAGYHTNDSAVPVLESHSASGGPGAATGDHGERSDLGAAAHSTGLATEMARSLDLDRLALAIVAQMKQRTGPAPDSDCDDSEDEKCEAPALNHRRRLQHMNHGGPAALPPPGVNASRRNATEPVSSRRDTIVPAVVGTGDSADIKVLPRAPAPITFVLEGIHPDTPDSNVHQVVSAVVRDVNQFLKIETSDDTRGKTLLFTADNCEESVVLNPANWPLGLQIRRSENTEHLTRDTSMKRQPELAQQRQQPPWLRQQ